MTEEEWLKSLSTGDISSALRALGASATDRKLRLFVCAYCRMIWPLLSVENRNSLEVAEAHADGLASASQRDSVLARAEDFLVAVDRNPDSPHYVISAALSVVLCLDWIYPDDRFASAYLAGNPVETAIHYAGTEAPDLRLKLELEQHTVVRDIFGNPFCPVTIDPRWLSSTVHDLAQTLYDERAFDRMPILADALMDAGCDNKDIIAHCRQTGEHVRGCWVLDLILGKK